MNELLNQIWGFATSELDLGVITLPFSLVRFVLEFLLPFVAGIIILRVIRRSLSKLIQRSEMKADTKDTLDRWMKIITRVLGLSLLIILSAFLMGAEFFTVISSVGSILNEPFFKSGDLAISVMTLITAIPVFYVASWAGKASRSLIEREVLGRIPVDQSRGFSIANISRYIIMFLVAIIGLSMIGINLSSLIVIFSVLGIGIGFGLQSLVANFFAGLIIIITRPIKEGDFIITASTAEPVEGHVVRITLMHSVINTLLNENVIVPNTTIIDTPVHNYSYDGPDVTVLIDVDVHYESDLDQVERILLGIGKECPFWGRVVDPVVRVKEFAASGITMGLYVRIANSSQRLNAMSWLRKETWRRFKQEGITIPYPQMDLYIKEGIPGMSVSDMGQKPEEPKIPE